MNHWKTKLAAYLHDPPTKALEIGTHRKRSETSFRQAGFIDTEVGDYLKSADHIAAAEARLPFPNSQKAALSCAFDGVRNGFRHPLSGEPIRFDAEFRSAEEAFEIEETTQPCLSDDYLNALPDDDTRWRARFFAHWRLWPRNATQKDYRMGFLPADTRIPDHSIWSHMQVVSALAGCLDGSGHLRPAFLRLQLGPVQDFIAAARSNRDLWSGSYLLSWLMAAGLKALTSTVGPDAVIFPNLRDQPLFDLHWRKDLWQQARLGAGSRSIWESLDWSNTELLTPNLPNVFLALVPAHRAAELARVVETAIRNEWKSIADAVWEWCDRENLTADEADFTRSERQARFDRQVAEFLTISWCVTPWPESLEAVETVVQGFRTPARQPAGPEPGETEAMPICTAWDRVQAVIRMATIAMPRRHQDNRFYRTTAQDEPRSLNNIGISWSVLVALNAWELDAVRQTRTIPGSPSGWTVGTFSNKDHLTGREEAVAGGRVWHERAKAADLQFLFKDKAWLGAPTLVKRLWHRAYLGGTPWNLRTGARDFPMPDTREVAAHHRDEVQDAEEGGDGLDTEGYFAVLAFDGDQIGKWISGEMNPPFSKLLADYTDKSNSVRGGALEYFQRDEVPDDPGSNDQRPLSQRFRDFLGTQRPVSSGFHLQFSEALGNFALLCARDVVKAFDGHLIYAGGDDVLAVLPADTALACACALRAAFRGDPDLQDLMAQAPRRHEVRPFRTCSQGFVLREDEEFCSPESRRHSDEQKRPVPRIVPGSAVDASVGIAIAHFKAPLQDVVRAARDAERRAKRDMNRGGLGRKAVGVTLMKRSGEIIEWGTRWDAGFTLYHRLREALEAEYLSGKFCHRWVELLEAYQVERTGLMTDPHESGAMPFAEVDEVIRRELEHVLSRQRGKEFPQDAIQGRAVLDGIRSALNQYLAALGDLSTTKPERRLQAIIGLCQTCAFAHRTRPNT